jgi:hypothetical protein
MEDIKGEIVLGCSGSIVIGTEMRVDWAAAWVKYQHNHCGGCGPALVKEVIINQDSFQFFVDVPRDCGYVVVEYEAGFNSLSSLHPEDLSP